MVVTDNISDIVVKVLTPNLEVDVVEGFSKRVAGLALVSE